MAAKARTPAKARAVASRASQSTQRVIQVGAARAAPIHIMPANPFNGFTDYGIGIGLRVPHYQHILTRKPVVDWFEIISENFMVDGGRPLEVLDQILEQYRVVQHGVSMYFGSADKLNREHLKRLKTLVKRTKTPWLSDHLCWGSVDGRYTHDLLPMPYTFAAAKVTAEKVRAVRDYLEIPIAVENVSSYAEFHASEMTEWEFLTEVVEQADCGILLDVNNLLRFVEEPQLQSPLRLRERQTFAIIASRKSTLPAIPNSRSTFSTRTIIPCSTPCGNCTPAPPNWSARPRHCWSGMTASHPSTRSTMKRSKRTGLSIKLSRARRAPRAGSAKELGALQSLMAGAIMRSLAPGDRMQKTSTPVANAIIKPNDRLTSFERLEIYNRQYWFRILSCFYDDYPGLRAVIGDPKFDRLARAYLARYPSACFTLRNLGSRLEKFLRAEPKWVAPHERLASDMVRLEWAHIVAFDEGAKPVLHVDDFLGSNPSKVHLGLQPYITLLEVHYPVDDLLLAAKKGDDRLRAEASNAYRRDYTNGAPCGGRSVF